jgi:UDP-glucose 4-epimerase
MGPTSVKRWAYAVSKLYDEHLAFAYSAERGAAVTILRFFGGYGPRQHPSWWGGPQAVFIDAALRDAEMEIHGDGLQTRSFTYIGDHVDGIVRAIERREAVGEIFNLGDAREIAILDLARLVWRLAGQGPPKYRLVSYRTFGRYEDVRRRVPDASKAARLLGFEPRVSLEEGLPPTIAWHRTLASAPTRAGEGAGA